ncbi:MAG: methyl-accepting chemotaxis protein [Synergistaceae bacterium]|jgi:methyl-accepting chemotaxis protein|nr:methyl-accepting chemotaxis protein [Synergistaceae bacterium]
MASKLMVGFGLLVMVFLAAIAGTWNQMAKVAAESAYLSDVIVREAQTGTDAEREAYELFLSVRDVQYTESGEAVASSKEWMSKLEKTLGEMTSMGEKDSSPDSPKMVNQKVLSVHKVYADNVNRMYSAVDKKNEAYAAMEKAGDDAIASIVLVKKGFYDSALTETCDFGRMKERIEQLSMCFEIVKDIERVLIRMRDASKANDIEEMKSTMATVMPIVAIAQKLQASTSDPERKTMMDKVMSTGKDFVDGLGVYVQTVADLKELTEARKSLMKAYNDETSAVSAYVMERVKTLSQDSAESLETVILVLLALAVFAIIAAVSIAFFISRSLTNPLNTIVGLTKRCQEGDLTIEREDFGYEGEDELGRLVEALSNMVVAQKTSMQQVVKVAGDLFDVTDNLSSIAEETNASMEEIKASIDQVTALSQSNSEALEQGNAGVEEMSAGADTVAQSAMDSAKFIEQTTAASYKAGQTVDVVIKVMRDVDRNAKESEAKTRQLVSSVGNVNSFVAVITGIAAQTNLLALNAAIEAARAGEAGRGFAVVAEEVRKLAEESARAAQNVNNIIADLRQQAQESIEAATAAGQMLGSTLAQAEQSQNELDAALKEIAKANDSIQNIATVAEEQAASCKDVATAIGSATQLTVEMADTVERIRHAAGETSQTAQNVAVQSSVMSEHAQSLNDVLSRFKLHDTSKRQSALEARRT